VATDAPDWQKVVTLISGGSMSDAPDWQRTVTGPGATPVGGYASITGEGQANTPGDLTQAGGLTIDDSVSNVHNTTGVVITTDKSSTYYSSVALSIGCNFGAYFIMTNSSSTMRAIAATKISLESAWVAVGDDPSHAVGFYGSAHQAQQTVTGSRGGNAALASLLAALANFGLIVDGTTA